MNQRPMFVAQLDLAAVLTAVSCSRLFASTMLRRWNARFMEDDALLVVSELVTNAVQETGVITPEPSWSDLDGLKLISVRLLGFAESIVVEVWDVSPEVPKMRDALDDEEGGRGLHLVEVLSDRWGAVPSRHGKVVWAELAIGARASKTPLPTRTPAETPKSSPYVPAADADLLRRLISGLRKL